MKRNWFLTTGFGLAVCASASAFAAGNRGMSPELQKLDVSAGRWVYHGQTLHARGGRAESWTWNEDCSWSQARFMVCSFRNDWAGMLVHSVVVDTYNGKDRSYWHYELFDGGDSGAKPFIARMAISGNTRIEYAEEMKNGKKSMTRITYVFDTPTHVNVKIETSGGGAKWVTVDEGVGVKQP